MKRSDLEKYLGKTVTIRLFDGAMIDGELHKTREERFKNDPNLYIPFNRYFLTIPNTTCCKSCVFRSSHVTKLTFEGDMEMKIQPRKPTDRGGILTMPLRKNVPLPRDPEWKSTICLSCGRECWDRPLPEGYTEDMFAGKLCTECALIYAVSSNS